MLADCEPDKAVIGAEGGQTVEEQGIAVDMKNKLMDEIWHFVARQKDVTKRDIINLMKQSSHKEKAIVG